MRDVDEKFILDSTASEIFAELRPTRSHNFSDDSSTNYYKHLRNKINGNIKAQICYSQLSFLLIIRLWSIQNSQKKKKKKKKVSDEN